MTIVETNGTSTHSKIDDEKVRHDKRLALKELNEYPTSTEPSKLDSSLKRHTALIKRMRQSMAADNRDQILKDIDTLSLEKYIEEIVGAVMEGIVKCKTEKDVWSAVEAISHLYQRFPKSFTPALITSLASALSVPSRASLQSLTTEQREKEDSSRVIRQRPILRVCSELALVGVIRDGPGRSGGEWIMKIVKEMLSNDPSLSSLPLLSSFLKTYSLPFLGIVPTASSKQISATSEPGSLSSSQAEEPSALAGFPSLQNEVDQLIEKDTRDRFKRMCEGYFDNVCKKLLIEHTRLQEQDRRNHEAYIRSGEIFEDRQQAYEKMTKSYEKLLANCQHLSELLCLSLPTLPTSSRKADSIQIGLNNGSILGGEDGDKYLATDRKWEDEEERKFYEEVQDLKDFVPKSVLGIDEEEKPTEDEEQAQKRLEQEKEEFRRLEEELEKLNDGVLESGEVVDDIADDAPTPTPGTPKPATPPLSPHLAPQGPSQLLSALLARLPDATNRALIDQAAIDFAFLNSKAARKRLVKFLAQVPKNRTDLLPHYSRLVATLYKYMPDIGTELVGILDDEFRYLQRKKNIVKDLAETRLKNIMFISNLTKFRVVPTHVILHMFKVCLDDFAGNNVENLALLLEGCGRFLLRSEDTRERFGTMLELMRRKQSMQHFDQRQLLLLENAYYQCNPPERAPRQEKERTPMELFIRHLIFDVLAKKTIDKIFKLIRKLDWEDPNVRNVLFKIFTKPWKLKFSNISLMAMLTYDLQRYHPSFSVAVVDQVLEDVRRGLEQNVYSTNQRRIATMKYLGELYIYRLLSSGIIFDTLWSLVTFGHPDGRPLPHQACPLDMPNDFFRIRLICALIDTCGMCFDRGTQKKKLDNFLVFFQYYVLCKNELPMDVDFMLSDSLEARIAVRPKFQLAKTVEEAANTVDEMLNSAFQNVEITDGEDSGEDSGGENERREDDEREEEEDEEVEDQDSEIIDDRPNSPEERIVLSSGQENVGPSEEADAEFAKELAKLVTDTSNESRKVDKKTALALWDSAILPPAARRKRLEESEEDASGSLNGKDVMTFTVVTKKGNKQQTRQLAVPSESALAIHTRSAQLQDKVEQQHLKRLVLDYEQREEAEELKALEARNRSGAIKIRYVG
ncbi:ARM repeat-containing protein [Marasmius fiardii PR-910]|nr:ARM repeat-containing protein [Marasmius fiardii PR-910]